MKQVRLCAVWPMEDCLGTFKTTYRVGWMIWICYSRALDRRCLFHHLPGLMGNWQNWLIRRAWWWIIPYQSQSNPGSPGDEPPCIVSIFDNLILCCRKLAASSPCTWTTRGRCTKPLDFRGPWPWSTIRSPRRTTAAWRRRASNSIREIRELQDHSFRHREKISDKFQKTIRSTGLRAWSWKILNSKRCSRGTTLFRWAGILLWTSSRIWSCCSSTRARRRRTVLA